METQLLIDQVISQLMDIGDFQQAKQFLDEAALVFEDPADRSFVGSLMERWVVDKVQLI